MSLVFGLYVAVRMISPAINTWLACFCYATYISLMR